jgi:N6-L-threonylcarbamoyladenine synthase
MNAEGPRRVLGIETSCDETAAAVVRWDGEARGTILANVVASQVAEHAPYGGVVPEIAARAHVARLDGLIARACDEAGLALADLDAVAATAGPGLLGGLIVGLVTGKALASALGKPFVGVNHLEGHALTPRLTHGLAFPYLVLLVSGGHTQILAVEGVGRHRRLATTVDDALGEAFDKVAKLLGLGFPGGPEVERRAAHGDPDRFALPRPMVGRPEPWFSFSGLKTAVRQAAEAAAPLSERDVADLCAAFQVAAAVSVSDRLARALERFRASARTADAAVAVAGGVAANRALAGALAEVAARAGARLVTPPPALCTDNGAMIAWAGAERLARGLVDGLDLPARARWPLDPEAEAAPFAGVKA